MSGPEEPETDLALPIRESEFRRRLLDWYRTHRRQLPWREDPHPYRVWVSEVMLQQTQVSTVLPHFERFLKRFPTVESLAAASEEDVLTCWSGLGYYNRARNLQRAARRICRQHQGRFPRSYREAVDLPGVGRYTAGAVLSIAYGEPLAVLDGNVRRVLVRYLKEEPADSRLWALLEGLVERLGGESVSDFNQALMELGALVCRARDPECPSCPLSASCRARSAGVERTLPTARLRRPVRHQHYCVAVVAREGRYLLRQNREEPYLADFWEFPKVRGRPGRATLERFRRQHGITLAVERRAPAVQHQITFRRLHLYPLVARIRSGSPPPQWIWSRPDRLPVSSWLAKVLSSCHLTPRDDGGLTPKIQIFGAKPGV